MIDFSGLSLSEIVEVYNYINRDIVDTKNGYHQQRNLEQLLEIKKLLVHKGVCSPYVLDYEGKL
jgi:hypothetical protein